MSSNFSERGFTLVELLVTISIMGLILGASVLSLKATNLHRQLVQAAEGVRLAIYETRSLALAPATNKTSGSDGYRFITTTASDWEIRETDVTLSDGTITAPGRLVRSGHLSSGFQMSTTPAVTQIVYKITDQGRVSAPNPTDGQLTLTFTPTRADASNPSVKLVIATLTSQIELCDERGLCG